DIDDKLKKFKTEKAVSFERRKASSDFKETFEKYVSNLKVKHFEDERFYLLYDIPTFPRQGVELLKTLLAYNFAFLEAIKPTTYTHIFPFLMDAIFEGDLEDESRADILNFIRKNSPTEQQVIFSIADSKSNINSASSYNKEHFNGQAKLICIGSNMKTRSFLNEYNGELDEFLAETLALIE
ncbi:hypothetical protein L1D44_21330, partial [Shewanella sp. Isolate13]|uniref:hypothetical protein n=1 Tax=Shewanella sp. Isolate13 TaxID=2908531 RepID=UPI001EFE8F19